MYHSSTSSYIPNFVQLDLEKLHVDRWTDIETSFIRSTQRSREIIHCSSIHSETMSENVHVTCSDTQSARTGPGSADSRPSSATRGISAGIPSFLSTLFHRTNNKHRTVISRPPVTSSTEKCASTRWPQSSWHTKSLSFLGFSRAINLLFHSLSQQKVIVIMTSINGRSI